MKAKDLFFFIFFGALATMLVALTFTTFTAFSGFAAALAKAAIGITLFYLFDKIVLKEVDTIYEITTNKNQSYAIFLLAFALILAATIATA